MGVGVQFAGKMLEVLVRSFGERQLHLVLPVFEHLLDFLSERRGTFWPLSLSSFTEFYSICFMMSGA